MLTGRQTSGNAELLVLMLRECPAVTTLGDHTAGLAGSTRTFEPGLDIAVGSGSRALAMADFNADGIADLAVANGSSNNVRILLGNGTDGHGDGTFTPGASYATQSLPHALDAGDFNEDGIVDLAVGNASSSSISILIGNGSGGAGDGTSEAGVGSGRYSRMSPGWHCSALQIASSVDSRIPLTLPFFRTDMLAGVMPTLSASSVTRIFRFANMTSMLMMIAMLPSLHR